MDYWPIIIGLIPSFAWLYFYLGEDPHPEPKKLVFEAFLLGSITTFLAFYIQKAFGVGLSQIGASNYSPAAFFIFSAVEELLKFGAAFILVKSSSRYFDEPVDAMIYIVVVALGFAAVENVAAAINSQGASFEITTLRFIGATLLHTISSAIIGYYWAISIISHNIKKLIAGCFLAILLHTIFNYLIIRYEPALMVPTGFLIIAAMVVLYDFEKLKYIYEPRQ